MQQILEVDFKFSDRKAAMEDARTSCWIVKSVGSSVSLFPIPLGGWTFSPFFFFFFYFRVAKRVGSAVTNETTFVGYQISNFLLMDWRTNFWIVKSAGSSSLMMDGTTPFAGEL